MGQNPCEVETLAKQQSLQNSRSSSNMMAANPTYIGSSRIAAEASGAGAGWKADPLEDVRDMFTTLGMIIT